MNIIDLIPIWHTGFVNYENDEKPVKFTEKFLQDIADNTDKVDITEEHSDKIIGSLSNFKYEDGVLYAEKPSDIDISGRGLSPLFVCDYIDGGNFFEPINYSMTSIGLTDKPRSQILYNSVQVVGDDDVSDELRMMLDKKEETIAEQREEIGVLNKQMEELRQKVQENEATSKDFAKLQKEYDSLVAKSEEYKVVADKFNAQEKARKDELIKEICGDDPKGVEMFSKHSVEELEYMRDTKIITEPNKGVGADTVITDERGDAEDEVEVDKYSAEYFEQWEKENSNW